MTISSRSVTSLGGPLLLMAGCATAPITPVTPSPPTPQPIPTAFREESRIGRLWKDLQERFHEEGKAPDLFARGLDRGFIPHSILHDLPLPLQNRAGVIEAQEVLTFAYNSKRAYPLLRKHGFHIPFASDETDPRTAGYRRFIGDIVIQARSRVPNTIPVSLDADEYRLALGREIYLGLREYMKGFTGDCTLEQEGWMAYEKKCGACSERSSILYEAYETAGLRPIFLHQHRIDLPIRAMLPVVLTDNASGAHILVGLARTSGKPVVADLALHRFGSEDPNTHEVSKSFFAASFEMNLLSDQGISSPQREQQSEILHELNYLDPTSSLLLLDLQRFESLEPSRFDAEIEPIRQQLPNSALARFVVEFVRWRNQLKHQSLISADNLFQHFIELERDDPQTAGIVAVHLVSNFNAAFQRGAREWVRQGNPESAIPQHFAGDIAMLTWFLEHGLAYHPYHPALWSVITAIDNNHLLPGKKLFIIRKTITKNPNHLFARFAYATTIIQSLDHTTNRQQALDMGLREIQVLLNSEASQDPYVLILASQYAALLGTSSQSTELARKAFSQISNDNDFIPGYLSDILTAAYRAHDVTFYEQVLGRIQSLPKNMMRGVLGSALSKRFFPYYADENSTTPLSREHIKLRLQLFEKACAISTAAGVPKDRVDNVRIIHALHIILLAQAGHETAQPLLRDISDFSTNERQRFIVEFMQDHYQIKIDSGIHSAAEAKAFLAGIAYLDRLLTPANRAQTAPLYRSVAVWSIAGGHTTQGREALQRMVERGQNDVVKTFQEAVLRNDILNQTTPTFLMRRLEAFKLIWEHRDHMTPEMRTQLHDQCHDLEFHFSNVRDIPHVIEARRLADQFESYQPPQRPTTR